MVEVVEACGICSGEHRSTGGYAGGTCLWDATYPYSECCASSAFTNAADPAASCAFGGKCPLPLSCPQLIYQVYSTSQQLSTLNNFITKELRNFSN